MIPKIIHYCWLSDDPVPAELQNYMASWKKFLPDYEFWKWDFTRFPRGTSQWVDEAFDNKKYAFAADYIRIFALYNYGGIYLDMDVEVLKPFDDLLSRREFICWEADHKGPEVAAFGAEPKNFWMETWLKYYENRHFVKSDGKFDVLPLPQVLMKVMANNGWKWSKIGESVANSVEIFSSDYFSPKSYQDGKIYLTEKSYCIHHFAGSWLSPKAKFFNKLKPLHLFWIPQTAYNIKTFILNLFK